MSAARADMTDQFEAQNPATPFRYAAETIRALSVVWPWQTPNVGTPHGEVYERRGLRMVMVAKQGFGCGLMTRERCHSSTNLEIDIPEDGGTAVDRASDGRPSAGDRYERI